jgi:hypothetical protein
VTKNLADLYRERGDFKQALEFRELETKMRDSLVNESNKRMAIRSQMKYEYEKRAAADSVARVKENEIRTAELSRQAAELKAKKNQEYALYGGLFLVLLFAGFMFNRYKITQNQKVIIEVQKREVEDQKLLVEAKQKEVLDSIHYSKRIQLAQMPTTKRMQQMLNKANPHVKH